MNACDGVESCAAIESSFDQPYSSFDLHFLASQCRRECFVYYGEGDSGDFSVSNSDVLAAYGYNGDIVYGG